MNQSKEISDYIVLLISNHGNRLYGRTYLQKFFFLLKKEFIPEMNLIYTKYLYGPFSIDLVNKTNSLIASEIITEKSKKFKNSEGHFYELTEKGIEKVKKIEIKLGGKEIEKFKKLCMKYRDYTPSELLKLVYKKYPEWAANSKLLQ